MWLGNDYCKEANVDKSYLLLVTLELGAKFTLMQGTSILKIFNAQGFIYAGILLFDVPKSFTSVELCLGMRVIDALVFQILFYSLAIESIFTEICGINTKEIHFAKFLSYPFDPGGGRRSSKLSYALLSLFHLQYLEDKVIFV